MFSDKVCHATVKKYLIALHLFFCVLSAYLFLWAYGRFYYVIHYTVYKLTIWLHETAQYKLSSGVTSCYDEGFRKKLTLNLHLI